MNKSDYYLSIKQIEYVHNIENLTKEILSYTSIYELKYAFYTFIFRTPIHIRYDYYTFLSFCLKKEFNFDIIKVLKTRLKELEAKNYV